jgi:hypothetical protein
MAIGRISGPMLYGDLDRQGINLSFDGTLLYLDVTNRRVGVNTTSPAYALDINSNVRLASLVVNGNTITSQLGNIELSSTANISGYLIVSNTTSSISSTTGALVIKGGMGITGNINISGSSGNAIVTTANVYVGNLSATQDVAVLGNVTANYIYAKNAMIDRGYDQSNWDLLTTMGTYLVNRVSWSGTSNTPTETLNFTGLLEVLNTQDSAVVQNYRPYDASTVDNNYWTRTRFNNTWTNWVEIINSSGNMDGGSY